MIFLTDFGEAELMFNKITNSLTHRNSGRWFKYSPDQEATAGCSGIGPHPFQGTLPLLHKVVSRIFNPKERTEAIRLDHSVSQRPPRPSGMLNRWQWTLQGWNGCSSPLTLIPDSSRDWFIVNLNHWRASWLKNVNFCRGVVFLRSIVKQKT